MPKGDYQLGDWVEFTHYSRKGWSGERRTTWYDYPCTPEGKWQYTKPKPTRGMVVGKRTVWEGKVHPARAHYGYDGEVSDVTGPSFSPERHLEIYIVAPGLRLAHMFVKPEFITKVLLDQDMYRTLAAVMIGIKPEEVTVEQRRRAKELACGAMYGR